MQHIHMWYQIWAIHSALKVKYCDHMRPHWKFQDESKPQEWNNLRKGRGNNIEFRFGSLVSETQSWFQNYPPPLIFIVSKFLHESKGLNLRQWCNIYTCFSTYEQSTLTLRSHSIEFKTHPAFKFPHYISKQISKLDSTTFQI